MSSWVQKEGEEDNVLQKYAPKDITNIKDFNKEVSVIENNNNLSITDKIKYKRNLMKAVFRAKQQEIDHHLDSFENYLLAKKDVEAKAITKEAQEAIMRIEHEQLKMMEDIGLTNTQEISNTLIKAAEMLTQQLEVVENSNLKPDIKEMTLKNIRKVWDKTNDRILNSVDSYIDELHKKEYN